MTWPAVFDGIGAMFVRCDNDPDVQLGRIKPTPTWVAVKVNGSDITDRPTIAAWLERVRASHPSIRLGVWVWCSGPPAQDVSAWHLFYTSPAFVIYDVEAPYKTDEGAPADWPTQLVARHNESILGETPAAVTSYGAIPGYGNSPSSIDFASFASAGWPIVAQCYTPFAPGDEMTYATTNPAPHPGPYPQAGIHRMVRDLGPLLPGQAVYRPEGIDS